MSSIAITGELIVLFFVVIGGIGAFWWRIEGRLTDQDLERTAIQRELAEYKLWVAQNHVSASALRETEKRLTDAFEKLAVRLEAIVNRLDALATRRANPNADP